MIISTLCNNSNLCSEGTAKKLPDKKIVIIGAGLAGLTTGYRLYRKSFDIHVYEARNRVGGRILSAFVNGNIAELGAENIADGGSADNINQLIKELGLKVLNKTATFNYVFHHNGILVSVKEMIKRHNFNLEILKEQLDALKQTSKSMLDVFTQLFKPDDPLKACLSTMLAGYEGESIDQLSTTYVETLYHMIKGGICSAHQNNNTSFARINDGNSKLPEALAKELGDRVHLEMPLVSVTKNKQDYYTLTFKDGSSITADILVLAIPCPVYNDITFDENAIPANKLIAIRNICNGNNAKIIVPLSGSFPTSTIFLNDNLGIFTFVKTMITLYFTRESSLFLPQNITQTYAKAQPLLACGFEQSSLPRQKPTYALDKSFVRYSGPVGYSWPNDPLAKGTYSYIAPGQETLFTSLQEDDGIKVKTLFAPINQQLYFAGEHASTLLDVPGTMEAACQSGNLVANIIEKLILKNH
jgi:monoamine oxidase